MSSKRPRRNEFLNEVALIFLEGDTEIEFYRKLFPKYLGNICRQVYNLKGIFNIYGKILDRTADYLSRNSSTNVRLYCFVDKEDRYHNPPIDRGVLRSTLDTNDDFRWKILSADTIIATQMIESWFFYDIEGIYKFLAVPKNERNPNKYRPVEKFTANHLYNLFIRYGKVYIKGKRCKNFIDHLDTDKIYRKCTELRNGIKLILEQHNR